MRASPACLWSEGVGDFLQSQRFERVSLRPAVLGVPSFEFIELGFPFFEFGFVQFSAGVCGVLPLAVFIDRHDVRFRGLVVDVVRKNFLIAVSALQNPDCFVEIPDLAADFHAVGKCDVFSGNGIVKLGFGFRRRARLCPRYCW